MYFCIFYPLIEKGLTYRGGITPCPPLPTALRRVALPRVPRQDHNCNERRNPFSRDKWFLSLFKEVDILFNLEVLVKKRKLIQWAFLCMQQCHLNTAMNHNQNPGYFFWRLPQKAHSRIDYYHTYFGIRYPYILRLKAVSVSVSVNFLFCNFAQRI